MNTTSRRKALRHKRQDQRVRELDKVDTKLATAWDKDAEARAYVLHGVVPRILLV